MNLTLLQALRANAPLILAAEHPMLESQTSWYERDDSYTKLAFGARCLA